MSSGTVCHLLFEPGLRPVGLRERFASREPPLVEITPGVATVTPERGRMTLAGLTAALDAQRREVFAYLETLAGQLAQIRQAAGLPETQ
jgi:hypothetical protein